MPLVAFDSNVIDLWAEVLASDPRMGESLEALAWPSYQLSSSSHAIYWLAALAKSWSSCLYTFSDLLYEEVAAMPPEKRQYALQLFALAAELREAHPEEYRVVTVVTPSAAEVAGTGLAPADARHIADAIKLGAAYFLTCDRGMLKRAAPDLLSTSAIWPRPPRHPQRPAPSTIVGSNPEVERPEPLVRSAA